MIYYIVEKSSHFPENSKSLEDEVIEHKIVFQCSNLSVAEEVKKRLSKKLEFRGIPLELIEDTDIPENKSYYTEIGRASCRERV